MSSSLYSTGSLSMGQDTTEIEMSPAEVIKELQELWRNERLAPELLPQREEVVECVVDQVRGMEDNLAKSRSKGSLRNHVHRMELERINYMLCSYLRTRLKKIEAHVHHCLEDDDHRIRNNLEPKMTQEEKAFATEFQAAMKGHLERVWEGKLPSSITGFRRDKSGSAPNVNNFVFVKAKTRIEGVETEVGGHGDSIDFLPADQYLLPYKAVKKLFPSGDLLLI